MLSILDAHQRMSIEETFPISGTLHPVELCLAAMHNAGVGLRLYRSKTGHSLMLSNAGAIQYYCLLQGKSILLRDCL